MWVAHNADVADPPRDTHIPLRHLNCLAMKDEMDLGVGCTSLLTTEQHGEDVGTALRCDRIVEGVDDNVVQVETDGEW